MIPPSFLDKVPKAEEIFADEKKKHELLQIFVQTLNDFGYTKAADTLIQESEIKFENELVHDLRKSVIDGKWDDAINTLNRISMDEDKRKLANNLVNEQIYLELIAAQNLQEAITMLRGRLSQTCLSFDRLHKLGSLIVCKNTQELDNALGYAFSIPENRKNLLSEIQDKCQLVEMINSKRMSTLLHQALSYQVIASKWYDPQQEASFSLLEDFTSSVEPLPSRPIQTLTQHKDEVWLVKFSYDGKHIASVGKNHDLIVWNFDNETCIAKLNFRKEKTHDKEVNSLNWSYDSKKILTASTDCKIRLWDVASSSLSLTVERHSDIVCSAIWLPDNEHFVSGSIDNFIIMWNTDGEQVFQIKTSRITDLMISRNGKLLFSVSASAHKINVIDMDRKNETHTIQERDIIISVACSSDSRYLLVNTSHKFPELHVWSLDTFKLVQRYMGHSQEKYIIRCCFGGENDKLLACGGEDGKIRIWHRNSPDSVKTLTSHTLTVNSVHWHPTNQKVIASASDDGSLKLWVSEDIIEKSKHLIDIEQQADGGDSMQEEADKALEELRTATLQSIE